MLPECEKTKVDSSSENDRINTVGSVALGIQHFKAKQEIKAKGRSKLVFVQVPLVFGLIVEEAAEKPKEGQQKTCKVTLPSRDKAKVCHRAASRWD